MLKIGVTGGIGSGKSFVCSIISAMGYPVFNADIEARKIIDIDPEVVSSIKTLFGDAIYVNGQLDRRKVAELVFSNPFQLAQLNSIVHPAVANYFEKWANLYCSRPLIIKEAAILFESGAYQSVDKTIIVTAPLEIRIRRVEQRDGASRETILNRMSNQLPQEELIKRGDFIIENDGIQLILPQIVTVVNSLLKESE